MVTIVSQTQINMTNDLLGLWSELDNNDDSEVGTAATTTTVNVEYSGTPYVGVYSGSFNPDQLNSTDDSALVNSLTGFVETNTATNLSYSIQGFLFNSLAEFNAFENSSVFSGDDAMSSAQAADYVLGYAGNDYISTDYGNDTIYGGAGRVDSNDGNDTIYAGADSDEVYGNSGNDLIYGGSPTDGTVDSADLIYGGQGNDTIYGNAGNDSLYGGGDVYSPNDIADTVYGGQGDDFLYGNGGNDVLYGGAGNDWMHGGADADIFVFTNGNGADTIGAFVSGTDVIHIASNINDSGITTAAQALSSFSTTVNSITLDLGSGNSLTVEGITSLAESDIVII